MRARAIRAAETNVSVAPSSKKSAPEEPSATAGRSAAGSRAREAGMDAAARKAATRPSIVSVSVRDGARCSTNEKTLEKIWSRAMGSVPSVGTMTIISTVAATQESTASPRREFRTTGARASTAQAAYQTTMIQRPGVR